MFTTPTNSEPTSKVSTNSPTSLKNSSPNNTLDLLLSHLLTLWKALMTSELETSIGLKLDLLLQLKTKDNVVHAGPSPPLEVLKVWANKMELFRASLNNNSLIAQDHSETKLAMVVLWIMPSNTLKPTVLFTKMNIPTRLLNKPAKSIQDPSRSVDSLTLRTATILPLASLEDLSQLLLMLPTGHPTEVEFSITARLPLTTVSYSSESLINTGGSRTHGEPHGERTDSSDLPEEIPAVSVTLPHIPPNDFFNHIHYLQWLVITNQSFFNLQK